MTAHPPRAPRAPRRGFTLLELLVVIGILLVLAVLTGIGVTKVTRDARLAGATNTIISSLGGARAIAIRDSAYVLVTFRVATDTRSRGVPSNPQVVEIVTARWTGEVINSDTPRPAGVTGRFENDQWADRFLPVPGAPAVRLPPGVMVAGPDFGRAVNNQVSIWDKQWRTQPRFGGTVSTSTPTGASAPVTTFTPDLTITEMGFGIGVLFGPDGRMLSRNPEQVGEIVTAGNDNQNAWVRAFVDYDGNGYPSWGTTACPDYTNLDQVIYDEPLDEAFIDYVPYLAVFSDDDARERFPPTSESSPSGWRAWRGVNIRDTLPTGSGPRIRDLSNFINEQSDRISFNRFTGVAGVVPR
jgi:prepilin-type N-terminal cleavage/methylation domain-containing protein